MRHAKSAWNTDAPTDFERPLTGRGRRAARRMGHWLRDNDLIPDLVLASTATRVEETVERMKLPVPRTGIEWDRSLYGGDQETWLSAIRRVEPTNDIVLLCGHNPGLEDLARFLTGSALPTAKNGKRLTTAAVARLTVSTSWDALDERTCTLTDLVRPRSLEPRDT